MDHRTRKLMTMHTALHPRHNVDRLYVSRNGGRGLVSIQGSVDMSVKRTLHKKVKKDWLQRPETQTTPGSTE